MVVVPLTSAVLAPVARTSNRQTAGKTIRCRSIRRYYSVKMYLNGFETQEPGPVDRQNLPETVYKGREAHDCLFYIHVLPPLVSY